MRTIAIVVYLVIGLVVAGNQHYLSDIGSLADLVNLLLAVVLWPLLLVGVDFHLKFGGGNDGSKKGALFLLSPALVYARAALQSQRA